MAVIIKIRVHVFAATHVKPAPVSEQIAVGINIDAAQETGELLACKFPPPMRLENSKGSKF